MASTGKRKTTMAKLNRERRLLERRIEKKAKKNASKRAAAEDTGEAAGTHETDATELSAAVDAAAREQQRQ
jgi:hypothetical protein